MWFWLGVTGLTRIMSQDETRNGMDVLLGATQSLTASQYATPQNVAEPSTDTSEAHRKALLDIMTSFVPITSVKFSKRLSSIRQRDEDVVLQFADGETAHASILVGADGIQSTVRRHVLEPQHAAEVDPVYAHSYCYRAVIPMPEAKAILGDLTDTAKFYFGHQRSAVTYRISGGKVSIIRSLTRSKWLCSDHIIAICRNSIFFTALPSLTVSRGPERTQSPRP
jgi:2-polyprenyl-6-methoxyphenol hydroxylase-like FAD-dependent oxidoreductase